MNTKKVKNERHCEEERRSNLLVVTDYVLPKG